MDRIDKDSNDDIEKFRLNFSNRLTVTSLFLSLLFLQFISYQIATLATGKFTTLIDYHWQVPRGLHSKCKVV